MNKNNNFIKSEIKNAAEAFPFPENQLESIHEKLSDKKKGEVVEMKKSTLVKVAAAALVLVAVSGSVGFAAGRASQWYSWGSSDLNADFSDYEKSIAVFDEDAVLKEFSNGFVFTGFSNGGSAVKDENGNTLGNGSRIDVTYTNGENSIVYSIEKGSSTVYDDISSAAVAEYKEGDTIFYFHELKNKFVPTDYEMTPEEKVLVESGKLNVGYGSSQVEEKTSQSIYWQKDGNIHSLFGFDTGLTGEELFEMAKEL